VLRNKNNKSKTKNEYIKRRRINKMEEKIVMVMEVEHATQGGGKAKPSSRDKCMVPPLA